MAKVRQSNKIRQLRIALRSARLSASLDEAKASESGRSGRRTSKARRGSGKPLFGLRRQDSRAGGIPSALRSQREGNNTDAHEVRARDHRRRLGLPVSSLRGGSAADPSQRLDRRQHDHHMVSPDEASECKALHRFRVALLGGEPAIFVCYLGYYEAADEAAAIEAAAREFKIASVRDRLVARRDE